MPEYLSFRAGRRPGNPRTTLFWALTLIGVLSGTGKTLAAETRASDFSGPQGQAAAANGDRPAPSIVPPGQPVAGAAVEDVDLEGSLSVVVEDRPEGSRRLYFLETAEGRYELEAPSTAGQWQTGMRVRVRGKLTNGVIALEPGAAGMKLAAGSGVSVQSTTALAGTLSAQRTAVLLVNFPNNTAQPYTTAYARNIVFTGTSNFDLENSYGQTWLTGDAFGWYTIALNLSTTVCDFATMLTLGSQAQSAAAAAGVNLSGYTRFVYGFPDPGACGWWGLGTVGGNPSLAFINGDMQVQVVAHEMGHGLGLDHSHSLDCGTQTIGGSCTMNEYGDTLDTMGSSTYHFNAFQKERLGWLNAGSSPPITTVTSTGTYSIDPYETAGSNPRALKISRGGTPASYYYVELRRGVGVDAGLAGNANVMNGVVIHQASPSDSNSSNLLDMTALTASWLDPALTVGQSFTDSTAKVTITPVSIGASGATVTVTLGSAPTCTRANPTVSLSPSQSAGVAAGTPVSFTVSVTNNDTSACTASFFDLTNTAPAGWTASFSSAALSLSAGATGSATLQVTSPASAASGSYAVSATAKNRGATAYSAAASATYVVANPTCAPANPLVTLSPSQSAGVAAGTPVSFTLTVTNKDSSTCTTVTFDLTDTVPAGWTAGFSTTALSLVAGATGSATLQVTSPASAANGSNPVTGTARNRAATGYAATGSASYLVSNPIGGTTTFADDFNRPDSTNLGTGWSEVTGNLVVSGGMARNAAGTTGNSMAMATALTGPTQSAEADFTSVDNNLGPRFGIVLRYQDSTNYYLIYRQTGGSSRLLISRFVNGVETILKTASLANPTKGVAFHIKGSVTGTTLALDFGGVNKVTATDATFTTGKVGILIGNNSSTTQQEADNFRATAQSRTGDRRFVEGRARARPNSLEHIFFYEPAERRFVGL